MKIAITGHTSGIGKYIFENYPNTVGFSRSNGFDICDENDRKEIVKQSSDCDVFINNAYNGFGQTFLLLDLFAEWKDTQKSIVNVGTIAADEEFPFPEYFFNLIGYRIHKLSLKHLCQDLSKQQFPLNIHYVRFGWTDTETIRNLFPEVNEKLTVDQAANKILEPLTNNKLKDHSV